LGGARESGASSGNLKHSDARDTKQTVDRPRREPKVPKRLTHPPVEYDSSTPQRSKRKANKANKHNGGGTMLPEQSKRKAHKKEGIWCEHQRRLYRCKDCGGRGICEHGKRRTQCRECDGASFCEHKIRRSICRECEGSSICVHNRQRAQCSPCQRGDTAPAAWPGEAEEMDPILRDVQLGVDLPPILFDP